MESQAMRIMASLESIADQGKKKKGSRQRCLFEHKSASHICDVFHRDVRPGRNGAIKCRYRPLKAVHSKSGYLEVPICAIAVTEWIKNDIQDSGEGTAKYTKRLLQVNPSDPGGVERITVQSNGISKTGVGRKYPSFRRKFPQSQTRHQHNKPPPIDPLIASNLKHTTRW